MRAMPAVVVIILLTACSKQSQLNRGLVDAGIAPTTASCMSQEMAKRLSAKQLRKLDRVANDAGKELSEMSVSDFISAARRVGDAEVILVTGAAAAYCKAL
ncbi:hypothetical protein J3454_15850 [Erythrobacter sp. NFXS35]|uniref:hypothetical protein n=1 Tax=Erythrobacter sp. NFXS35 TaxID=2818436 RepID=UPI0032DE2D80